MSIFIEEYTPKSFVVRGDTRESKDSLKALGGKWNSSLTDKDTGDKFGAWLFWSDKRKEIDAWFKKGCPKIDANVSNSTHVSTNSLTSNNVEKSSLSLEAKIDALTKMVEQLCRHHQINLSANVKKSMIPDSDIESDDDIPVVKPKRLLSK
jgi:hypothetical protein